jgi:hypothetical protein
MKFINHRYIWKEHIFVLTVLYLYSDSVCVALYHYSNIICYILVVGPSIFVVSLQNNQQIRRGSSKNYWYIPDLPQNVSASHCHHQGVVVTSEATQVICIVYVYGLWSIQSGQLSRNVTKCVYSGFSSAVDWYRGYGATTPCAPRP